MRNALTIDVEDYFHVTAFENHVRRKDWDYYPMRVADNTYRILDMLDEYGCKATFFVLGWVAKREPGLVRAICDRGHELASHGYRHELVYQMGPKRFSADVRKAKNLLQDLSGLEVVGYRAPSYSIVESSMWALDVLIEEGFGYDSSIFPISHDIYGMAGAERFTHRITREKGSIVEFPMTTVQMNLAGKTRNVPVAGGGYLRLLPVWFVKWALKRVNLVEGQPAVLYFHPWEIDPDQPRIRSGLRSRFRHYVNLETTVDKLRELLSCLEFAPLCTILSERAHHETGQGPVASPLADKCRAAGRAAGEES